jgi:hypothetical protein
VRPVFMVIANIVTHEALEMSFIEDDHMIQQVPPTTTNPGFCQGLRKAVRTGRLPMSLAAEITSLPNFES